MLKFFHGWQRRVACITLLMALACMTAWLRGYYILDEYNFGSGAERVFYRLVSSGSGLRLSWDVSEEETYYDPGWDPQPPQNYRADILAEYAQPFKCRWRWRGCGFDIGEASDAETGDRIGFARVPYWSIVIPLTLFSTYLLLRKPRVAKRTSVIDD